MREIIDRLRGDRSFMEYAQTCGMSQSWLYKIAQGEIKKPLPKDFVMKMITNSSPGAKVTYEEFRKCERKVIERSKGEEERALDRVRSKVVERALLGGATISLGEEAETSAWDFCLIINNKPTYYKAFSPQGVNTLDIDYLIYAIGCWVCSPDSKKNKLTIAVVGDGGEIEEHFSDMNDNVNVAFEFVD